MENHDNIRLNVQNILASAGVLFVARYIGEASPDGFESRSMDKWAIEFSRYPAINSPLWSGFAGTPDKVQNFDFFTGLGLRKKTKYDSKPVTPTAADVLYCLTSEYDALSTSFPDWCAELGYEEDSRKAFRVYESCQEGAKKLRDVFGHALIQQIREALEGY